MAMTAERPQVVFFGSGPVAASSLEKLHAWCNIEAVITKPQPAHHRQIFPVIEVAQRLELPLQFASNRRELDKLIDSTAFQSRVAVLIDYGIIVSQTAIDSFPLGIVNSHFSILPEWRGADPISFAILSGQPQTGVSLMLLVEKMDEGPLLAYGEYDLPPAITTPQLTDGLIELSDALLSQILPDYLAGDVVPQTQDVTGRQQSYSRKLSKEDGKLDFTKPAVALEREIRAFADWPKSRTILAEKDVVVTKAHVASEGDPACQPGESFVVNGLIYIQTADDILVIDRLKPAGKPEMTAQAFLAGNKLS